MFKKSIIILSFLFLANSNAAERKKLESFIVSNIKCFTIQELKQAEGIVIRNKLNNDLGAIKCFEEVKKIQFQLSKLKKEIYKTEDESHSSHYYEHESNSNEEEIKLLEANLIKAKNKFKNYIVENHIEFDIASPY